MKNRRILSGLICASLVFPAVSVFSAETISINTPVVEGNIITVEGEVSVPGTKIYVEITRQGAELYDKNNVYLARPVTADRDGEFSVSCQMPDYDKAESGKTIDGYFTVFAKASGFDSQSLNFSYISQNSRMVFFEELNLVKTEPQTLKSFLLDEENRLMLDAYGVLASEFGGFSESVQMKACSVISEKEIEYTEDNISEINEVIIAMRLNSVNKENIAAVIASDDIMARCSLSFEEITFENADEELLSWFYEIAEKKSEKNEFSAVNELDTLFDEAIVLKKVNDSHYSDLFLALDNYSGLLGLDGVQEFKTTKNLAKTAQEVIMKKVKENAGKIYDTATLCGYVKTAYNEYIVQIQQNNQNVASSGGGGSGSNVTGGGKGSGSNIVLAGSLPEETSTDEVEVRDNYFNDLDGYEWAKEAINTLAAYGHISGDGNGSFKGGRNVTRAEFLKMLMSAINMVSEDGECSFDDVKKSDWCYKYIASAYNSGIAVGKGDGSFGKNDFITREEAAVFMHRATVKAYLTLNQQASEDFADMSEIADWAQRSVRVMYSAGLINGVGENTFDPDGLATRAQAARMVYGIFMLTK